jgi:hypothetical protein
MLKYMRTRSPKKANPDAPTKMPGSCAVCGKTIKVRSKGKIIGGYYLGKIPLHRKSELEKMRRSGTRKLKVGPLKLDVYKYNPKPYKHIEYWECLACYRGQRTPLRNVAELSKRSSPRAGRKRKRIIN